jgi:hypothetical protein
MLFIGGHDRFVRLLDPAIPGATSRLAERPARPSMAGRAATHELPIGQFVIALPHPPPITITS